MSKRPVYDVNTLLLTRAFDGIDYTPALVNGVSGGLGYEWPETAAHKTDVPFLELENGSFATGTICGNYSSEQDGFRLWVEDGYLRFGALTADGWSYAECLLSDLPGGTATYLAAGVHASGHRMIFSGGKLVAKSQHLTDPTSRLVLYGAIPKMRIRSGVTNLRLGNMFRPEASFANAFATVDPANGFETDAYTVFNYSGQTVNTAGSGTQRANVNIMTPEIGPEFKQVHYIFSFGDTVALTPSNVRDSYNNEGNGLAFPGGNGVPIAPSWSEGRNFLIAYNQASGGLDMTQPLVVDVWFNADSYYLNICGASSGDPNEAVVPNTATHKFYIGIGYGEINFYVKDTNNVTSLIAGPWSLNQTKAPTLASLVWDPATQTVSGFIDGKYIGSAGGSDPAAFNFAYDLVIGGYTRGSTTFLGTISAMRIRSGILPSHLDMNEMYHGRRRAIP